MAKSRISGQIELRPKQRWLAREVARRTWREFMEALANASDSEGTDPTEAAVVAAALEATDAVGARQPERDVFGYGQNPASEAETRKRIDADMEAMIALKSQSPPGVARAVEKMRAVLVVAGREAQAASEAATLKARDALEPYLQEPEALAAWKALRPWADRAAAWKAWRTAAAAEVRALRAVWRRWRAGEDRGSLEAAWVTWDAAWTLRKARVPGPDARKRAKRRKARKAAEAAEWEALDAALDAAREAVKGSGNGAGVVKARIALEEASAARNAALAVKAARVARNAANLRWWSGKRAREALSASRSASSAVWTALEAVSKPSSKGATAWEERYEAWEAVEADVAGTQAAWDSWEGYRRGERQAAREALNEAQEARWTKDPPAVWEEAVFGRAEPWETLAERATKGVNHPAALYAALAWTWNEVEDLAGVLESAVEAADALHAAERAADATNEAKEAQEARLSWAADAAAWKSVLENVDAVAGSGSAVYELLVEQVTKASIEASVAAGAAARAAAFTAVKAANALDALDAETREWVGVRLQTAGAALDAALKAEPGARAAAALYAVRDDPCLDNPCLDHADAVETRPIALTAAVAQARSVVEESDAKTLKAALNLSRVICALQPRPG